MSVRVGGQATRYYELVGTDSKQVTVTATWTDWDVSAFAPGAKSVDIKVLCNQAGQTQGVRKNGSALGRYIPIQNTLAITLPIISECDDSAICEVYDTFGAGAKATFYAFGYWK